MNDQLPPPVPRQKLGLSITSLVLGILAIVPCSLLAGIPAIITGILALTRANKKPTEYGGKGMAIAGLVLGCVSMLIFPALMLPALAKAKARAQHVACINKMKVVAAVALSHAEQNGNKLPQDFAAIANAVEAPKLLVCPADRDKKPAKDSASVGADNVSYEFLLPGRDVTTANASTALLRCPIHENVAKVDGSVDAGRLVPGRRTD